MRLVLNRELIVHTAVEVVEREGPGGLSMRAVGLELGVTAMAMYRHVPSKDALIEGMAEYVMAALEVSEDEPDDWKAGARELVRAFRAVAHEYPRSLALVLESGTSIPVGLRAIERGLALCDRAGVQGSAAVHVVRSLMAFTLGSQLREAGFTRVLRAQDGDPAEKVRALSPARYPHVVALPDELVDNPPDTDFEFGVELFLSSVEEMGGRTG
ncbi:TetR/AcrR family transcriptional regulator [Spirillospora sp. NPDC047279]|uniref:TetR/AcrR family transcriptional regulator n=1 Tax=Spirillospora sp. NPDC047279 TaxID=3155478 RepID=UPI0033D572BA